MTHTKPELKAKKSVIFEVHYGDFEKFIEKVHNLEPNSWSVVDDQECGNDCSLSSSAYPAPLDEYEREDITKFYKTGDGQFLMHTLIQDAVNRGLIEPGKYLINVSW